MGRPGPPQPPHLRRPWASSQSVAIPPSTNERLVDRQLESMENSVAEIRKGVDDPSVDRYALINYIDEIGSLKAKLQGIQERILSLDDYTRREDLASRIERDLFDLRVIVTRKTDDPKKKESTGDTAGLATMSGVNLPRIEVPTFDGNILNWRIFWEQFDSAIHSKPQLTNSDKLTYLRDALKSGPAKSVISGLTQTSASYDEAVKCLQCRYDRPRLMHQAHVRKIQEAYSLKNGNGQELRRLHDHLQQHVRALRVSGEYDLDSYITATMELKLDDNTLLKWNEHSSKCERTPPIDEFLGFLDILARHHEGVAHSTRCVTKSKVAQRAAYSAGSDSPCVACKRDAHPLNNCGAFLSMSRDERWELIRKNGFCMNCLKAGHMANKCRASPACKKCRKTHHTLLHSNYSKPSEEPPTENVSSVTHVPQSSKRKQVLLMTCRAKVSGPDGSVIQARVFLDPGAACSFITERAAQQLRLPRRKDSTLIAGIAGVNAIRTRGAVSFTVCHVLGTGKKIRVEHAFVLPRVTTDMPASPVDSISQWKHLEDLDLADPDFGTPGRVDVLLGADYYGEIILRGRRTGPRGTPYALRTCLGWVLAGPLQSNNSRPTAYTCCTVTENDDILKRFWEIEDYNMKQSALSPEEEAVVQYFKATYSRDCHGRFIVPLPQKKKWKLNRLGNQELKPKRDLFGLKDP